MNYSIVVAKVVRQNEQYNYAMVGKGERYLVAHEEGENAGDKVVEYLAPYTKIPVVIEGVALQKSSDVILPNGGETIYKAMVQFVDLLESGRTKRTNRKVFVGAKTFREAHSLLEDWFANEVREAEVLSVAKTNLLEFLGV